MAKKRQIRQRDEKQLINEKMENRQREAAKSRRKEIVFTVIVALLFLLIAALGLWKLSGVSDAPADKLVFTVGEEKVYLDEVNLFFLQNTVNLGITNASLDGTTAEDGTPAADYYKQEVLEVIVNNKMEYQLAKKRGITLTEMEQKEVRSDAVQFMGKMNGSVLKELGITQECVEESYRQRYLAKKLEDTVTEEIEINDQRFCTIYLLLFPKVEMTEDGQLGEKLSEETIAENKLAADAAYAELLEGADIEEVAKKYGVEEYSGEESNMAESFGEPFSEYAATLKKDEISPVLDTDSCYAVVKMVEENNEEFAEQILSYYRQDVEKEKLEEERKLWYEETGISEEPEFANKVWDAISFYDYSKYMED